ncbi:zinc finger protein 2-like [Contarinia nasturtii]|uniref:zinc finger protein 2-like n=1 Tax=Contarinia nasturtii TaxID=265458 RepID=UPI0012D469D4|nr:zinc finger protein 2-like [Contarinia nasturtii]
MPKKRPQVHCASELEPQKKQFQLNFSSNILPEFVVDNVEIKTEPVEYDYEQMEFPTTKIYTENDANKAAVEAESGLISQLEIIKTEPDVDEATINAFREEMMQIANETESKNKSIKKLPSKKPKTKKKEKKSSENRNKSKKYTEPKPLEIERDGVKMVKCLYCDFEQTTRNRSLVKEHMRSHTGYAPHGCRHCRERFFTRALLICHVKTDHKTKKVYKCPLCRVNFFKKKDFEDHKLKCVRLRTFECHLCKETENRVHMHKIKSHMQRLHTGERTFQCKHCNEWFLTKCSLRTHMQHHPEIMPFKCSRCKFLFATEESKIKHEITCLNRNRFECHLCKYSYPKLSFEMLQMHMRKHTGEKPYQCTHCFKFYPRPEALSHHMQRHRELFNFACSRCHRRCLNSAELEEHEGKCRKRRYECHLCQFTKFGLSFNKFRRHFDLKHVGERYAKCMACPQSFSSNKILARHFHDKHPHLLSLVCPNCQNCRFATRAQRNAHFTLCFVRRMECYICKLTSKNAKTLRSHMVTKHTGEAKFHCKLCPRKFKTKINLKIHTKSHTKIGLVKCSFCSKQFSDNKYKKKHEFQCKRMYECYLCKTTFPSFAILHVTHMRTHLGYKPYACKHCNKRFVSIRTYNMHVIEKHLHQYKFKCKCDGIIVENKDVNKHRKFCLKPTRQAVGIVYFKCGLCSKKLPRVPDLRKHILSSECANHPPKSKLRRPKSKSMSK